MPDPRLSLWFVIPSVITVLVCSCTQNHILKVGILGPRAFSPQRPFPHAHLHVLCIPLLSCLRSLFLLYHIAVRVDGS
jgi:hypothetical protein